MRSRRNTGSADKTSNIAGRYAIAAAAVAAVVAGTFTLIAKDPPQPSCPQRAAIKAPTNGAEVDGEAGTDITGSVCDLGDDETVWIFEHDPYDGNYYLVYDAAIGVRPVASREGGFAIHDQPMGDPGDVLKRYEILSVVASDECRSAIMSKKVDEDGNYVFTSLPGSCDIADQVQILESRK